MSKYDVEFKENYIVTLSDPDAIKAYFVDGDWRKVFWELDDLEEVITALANSFQVADRHWGEGGTRVRQLEGFGVYTKSREGRAFHLDAETAKEIGSAITITIEDELEVYFVTEIPEAPAEACK